MAAASFYLAIPQPCHEDWAHMTPTERGRFCQACRKEVLDFGDMTAAEILPIIRQAPNGSVCGRIPAQVLADSRQQAEMAVRLPRWLRLREARQWLAAVGLPLLAVAAGPARAQLPAPTTTVVPVSRPRPATLQLRVYDPATGLGLSFAQIQLWQADSLLRTFQAEADGTARLPLGAAAAGGLRLLIEVPGYQPAEEWLGENTASETLAVPMRRGPQSLPIIRKEADAPVTSRMVLGGAISYVTVTEPSVARRVAQAPKRLFWWLRRLVGSAR